MSNEATLLFSMLIVALLAVSVGAPLAAAQTEPASEPGLVIVRVDATGPAAEAGIKRGDILLAMGEQEINQPADWFQAVRGLQRASRSSCGAARRRRAQPHHHRSRAQQPGLPGPAGLPGAAADEAASEPLLLPLVTPAAGAQVIEVVADSPASAAGLQADDVITAVDGKALDGEGSLADIIAGYQPGDEVTLAVTALMQSRS